MNEYIYIPLILVFKKLHFLNSKISFLLSLTIGVSFAMVISALLLMLNGLLNFVNLVCDSLLMFIVSFSLISGIIFFCYFQFFKNHTILIKLTEQEINIKHYKYLFFYVIFAIIMPTLIFYFFLPCRK